MKDLLFISHRFLYPLNKGERIRGFNLLRHLAGQYRVHLACLCDEPVLPEHRAAVQAHCAELACFDIDKRWQKIKSLLKMRPGRAMMLDYYDHPGLQEWVDGRMAALDVDTLYIYSTAMAPYALRHKAPLRVLDMQDIDSEKWTEYGRKTRLPMRAVWSREGRNLLEYERQAARDSDLTLLVSEEEARRLQELAPESASKITWVENGVDLAFFSPTHVFPTPYDGPGPHLVFTGNMDYWPNADAVAWFAADILPPLRAANPAIQFHIVGANPGSDVLRLAALPGIHVVGRVPDMRPYLAHATAAVVPLRIARGIQNKVLEAMAMGRPVVASPQAYEGVRAEAGRDLLVGADAGETARLLLEVIAGAHPGLGAAGRRAVEANYAWPATLARLDAVMAAARAA